MFASLLYGLTGFAALAISVIPLSGTGSLLGSVALIVAAALSRFYPRVAAGIALAGAITFGTLPMSFYREWMKDAWVDQRLEIIFARWVPGSEALSVETTEGSKLTEEESNTLHQLGLQGRLVLEGRNLFGSGKPSRMLVVLQHPVDAPVELRQPDGGQVLYVQRDKGWEMYPPNAATFPRTVRLEAYNNDLFMVQGPDCSGVGGNLSGSGNLGSRNYFMELIYFLPMGLLMLPAMGYALLVALKSPWLKQVPGWLFPNE